MTDAEPIACSLGASDFQQRLSEIAEVGAASLIGREEEGGRHILRFRFDPTTRHRLAQIVAAEAECCSFLDLALTEHDGELILTLAAPAEAQPVVDELAVAFAEGSR